MNDLAPLESATASAPDRLGGTAAALRFAAGSLPFLATTWCWRLSVRWDVCRHNNIRNGENCDLQTEKKGRTRRIAHQPNRCYYPTFLHPPGEGVKFVALLGLKSLANTEAPPRCLGGRSAQVSNTTPASPINCL